jgi:hypothetical protein
MQPDQAAVRDHCKLAWPTTNECCHPICRLRDLSFARRKGVIGLRCLVSVVTCAVYPPMISSAAWKASRASPGVS